MLPYCGDCSVAVGQLHLDACDQEECPRCFHQLLSCGCLWAEGRPEDQIEDREVAAARHAAEHERQRLLLMDETFGD